MPIAYGTTRLLVTLLVLISFGVLLWQRFAPTIEPARWHGSVLEGGSAETLRRGSALDSGEEFLLVELEGVKFALAARTELIWEGMEEETPVVKLVGGRILTNGPAIIRTPWITVTAPESVSVVNYSFDDRVQILPMSKTVMASNSTIGILPIVNSAEWVERERDLVTSLEPFDASASSEKEFYQWALPRISPRESLARPSLERVLRFRVWRADAPQTPFFVRDPRAQE
ncbi:hypothetical protein HYW18_03330 [Candidatus Uhrbacteria bacterium]|nr:hypothetical protein [Candidatus Uhrbacteria bacterium]